MLGAWRNVEAGAGPSFELRSPSKSFQKLLACDKRINHIDISHTLALAVNQCLGYCVCSYERVLENNAIVQLCQSDISVTDPLRHDANGGTGVAVHHALYNLKDSSGLSVCSAKFPGICVRMVFPVVKGAGKPLLLTLTD